MFLKYGNFQHDDGEVAIAISRVSLFTPGGVVYGYTERWDVQGRLQTADQATLTTALQAMFNAYQLQGQDISLHIDESTVTNHVMVSASSDGGTRVVNPPAFPVGRGAEYSTFRNYTLAVEADFLSTGSKLISWQEAFDFIGTGGPTWRLQQVLTGPAQRQDLTTNSTQRIVQRGTAIAQGGAYPLSSPSAFPAAEHQELRQITRSFSSGQLGQRTVNWVYFFETISPLSAVPTIRSLG